MEGAAVSLKEAVAPLTDTAAPEDDTVPLFVRR